MHIMIHCGIPFLSMDTIHKLSWKLRYDMYDKNTGGMTVFGKIVDLA